MSVQFSYPLPVVFEPMCSIVLPTSFKGSDTLGTFSWEWLLIGSLPSSTWVWIGSVWYTEINVRSHFNRYSCRERFIVAAIGLNWMFESERARCQALKLRLKSTPHSVDIKSRNIHDNPTVFFQIFSLGMGCETYAFMKLEHFLTLLALKATHSKRLITSWHGNFEGWVAHIIKVQLRLPFESAVQICELVQLDVAPINNVWLSCTIVYLRWTSWANPNLSGAWH